MEFVIRSYARSLRLTGASLLIIAGFIPPLGGQGAQAARGNRAEEPGSSQENSSPDQKKENPLPIPPKSKIDTKHDWTAGSRTVHYTATAGTLLINDDHNKPSPAFSMSLTPKMAFPRNPVPSLSSATAALDRPASGCTWGRSRATHRLKPASSVEFGSERDSPH